jgi:hypothetical protein
LGIIFSVLPVGLPVVKKVQEFHFFFIKKVIHRYEPSMYRYAIPGVLNR